MWVHQLTMFEPPRPTSATSGAAKPTHRAAYSFAVTPLHSLQYKAFRETSLSSQDLFRLKRDCKVQPHQEFPLEHCKRAAFRPTTRQSSVLRPSLSSKSLGESKKRRSCAQRKERPPKASAAAPARPQRRTSISFFRKTKRPSPVRSQTETTGCVWLYPRNVPSGLCSQPFKGKVIKDSAFFGNMFRPESSNPDIEDRASRKFLGLSTLSLKRIVPQMNRRK